MGCTRVQHRINSRFATPKDVLRGPTTVYPIGIGVLIIAEWSLHNLSWDYTTNHVGVERWAPQEGVEAM